MRPNPAQGRIEHPGKVLILGSIESAGRIAEQLRAERFEPVLHEAGGGVLPTAADPDGVNQLRSLLTAFRDAHAGEQRLAVHPGTSYWGERSELAAIGQELSLQIIGPPARALALFGNKLNLFHEAEGLGIPNLLLSTVPLHSVREIEQQPYSFPFILKAVKGGATSAHYVVHDAEELHSKFPLWMEQLRRTSGEANLLAERYLEGARAILVPFTRFADGRFEVFPCVDASLQCRHRKLVEFCPAPSLDASMEKQLVRWTSQLAEAAGFVGVGSMEYLVEGDRAFLINASPRLNRTFTLWERVAGTSAVAWQLAAFQGKSAEDCPDRKGPEKSWQAGMALRLYAEDPVLQLPQPGMIFEATTERLWNFPGAQAILDLLIQPGEAVSPSSSGMLGILWVGAQDRRLALTAARGVLDQIWLAGSLQTNERFLAELLAHPWLREGIFHAAFVDEEFLPSVRAPAEWLGLLAAVAAMIPRPEAAAVESPQRSERWAVGDQWARPQSEPVQWEIGPEFFSVEQRGMGLRGGLRSPEGASLRICAYPISASKWQIRMGNWILAVRRVQLLAAHERNKPRTHKLLALVAGRIHSILYREGNSVPAHEPMVVVESLGMLIPHALPADARIVRWRVGAEGIVSAGEELAEFEVTAKS